MLAVLFCAAPATLATGSHPRSRFGPSAAAVILLIGMALYGAARLGPPVRWWRAFRLRLVQPNLPQDANVPAREPRRHRRPLHRAEPAPDRGRRAPEPTHIVWPESAFPFLIQRDPDALAKVAAGLKPGQQLVTGAAGPEDAPAGRAPAYFNAVMVIGRTA